MSRTATMTSVQPDAMPRPAGHYSPGIAANGLLFVSGQLPMDPGSRTVVEGGIAAQTERALRNVELVLTAAGSSLDRVVQMTIYISDGELWGAVNETYARVLGDHRPARAVIPVSPLHYGALIEIQAIAIAP
jgi:2-iminobutanoate/2-iminopropanoate deaminase